MINAYTAAYLSAGKDSAQGSVMNSAQALGAGRAMGAMSNEHIDKVARDFESMFVAQMLEQMFGESLGDEAFGDKETNEVYRGMMIEQYGKQITDAGGIGLADYVKRELLKMQEA